MRKFFTTLRDIARARFFFMLPVLHASHHYRAIDVQGSNG